MSSESLGSHALTRRNLLLVGATAAVAACSAEVDGSQIDAATGSDALREDSAATDAATQDTAVTDVSPRDATPLDAPPLDATPLDATPLDVTTTDTFVADTSVVDAASPDAATTDVSRPDAATMDVTRPDAPAMDVARADVAADTARADVAADTARADVACVPPTGAVRAGGIAMFPVGRWVAVTAPSLILGRDARGIFAYTSVCTHRGCAVPAPTSATTNSRCPCHGATFTSEGAVVSGPTTTPLVHYPVIVCANVVYVDKSRTVPMGTRTPVP
jgi:Rieske Fe-S protein